MSLLIDTDGAKSYPYGALAAQDEFLRQAAAALQNEGVISSGDRSLYAHTVVGNGHT